MMDPELLNELKAMGYNNNNEKKDKEKKNKQQPMKKTISQQQQNNNQAVSSFLLLEKQMNDYKTMALNAKKNGNIPSAKEYYKQYKLLKEQF